MATTNALPIDDVLSDILSTLDTSNRLVISAPPGAGKTTRIPLESLKQNWAHNAKLLLVEPRRIAARAAAERMAQSLGERVGETVGLRSRLDVRTSEQTKLEVVTEGVFNRLILSDPALEGIAGIFFDEFHERSLDADTGLALAIDSQSVLRDDLRLIVMSATLPSGLTDICFPAPVIESHGRAFPIETHYIDQPPRTPIATQATTAIRRALKEEDGSILVFLPGAADIRRVESQLNNLPENVLVAPLFGALSPKQQTAAIASAKPNQRKIVLATDIAESALTIQGVRVVIDCGYARVPRYDDTIGASKLETVRIAKANADQRRGRAGRTQPGVCYRLWREAEMGGFKNAPAPEIENADLTNLRLDLAHWGTKDPTTLNWMTPPRQGPWQRAEANLKRLNALTPDGDITPFGRDLQTLPLSPTLSAMVLNAAKTGSTETTNLATQIAALLSERDLGGRTSDLDSRLFSFQRGKSQRETQMLKSAKRWAGLAIKTVTKTENTETNIPKDASAAALLASAYPERIACARSNDHGHFQLASGRGAFLDQSDPLANEDYLIVADLIGSVSEMRIILAAPIPFKTLEAMKLVTVSEHTRFNEQTLKCQSRRVTHIGEIKLEETPLPRPSHSNIIETTLEATRNLGVKWLISTTSLHPLLDRITCLNQTLGAPWPADFADTLFANLDDWFAPLLDSSQLSDISANTFSDAALTQLDWALVQKLNKLAPKTWTTPAGNSVVIDYSQPESPTAKCRVQACYGLKEHPTIAQGQLPLTLALLSPAQRPVATTRDIQSFWANGYHDMRKDMKGRYPKHDWPENPENRHATNRNSRQR